MVFQKHLQSTDFKDASSSLSTENERWPLNCGKCTLPKVNLKLLPLKITLFCWYGGAACLQIFLPIYFKQLGLSISQQSIIYMITPPLQFIGPSISGLIADKIGRSKIVLQANIILTVIFANAMLVIPKIEHPRCLPPTFIVNCSNINNVEALNEDSHAVNISMLDFNIRNCSQHCLLQQLSNHEHNLSEMSIVISKASFSKEEKTTFFRQVITYNDSYIIGGTITNLNNSWCEKNPFCSLTCSLDDDEQCLVNSKDNSVYVYVLSFIFLVCFQCTFSNCYRFMDVTSMFMVNTYNSDFGRERLWSIIGILMITPLAGFLVKITTRTGGPENYASAFYFFDVMIVVTMVTVMKLDVKINPPGKNMLKKSLGLIKEPDILMFVIALLILGTSWIFHKYFSFLFLDQLNAPSVLLGLLPAINSLAGIPFLATSNWWVKKLGSTNLLILGLISYTALCTAYSFLVQPWYALFYEVLGIFTYHLLWVAVVRHSHEIAPEGLTASVIATAGGIHFGIGRGTGSSIGLIMGNYGGRFAYRFVAVMCAITAFLYITYVFLRSRYHVKNQTLKEKENVQNDLNHEEMASPVSEGHNCYSMSSQTSNPS